MNQKYLKRNKIICLMKKLRLLIYHKDNINKNKKN